MQNILVSGASSGIGRKIAEYLANQSYNVYAGARKESDLAELSTIKNISAVQLDVTSQKDVNAARALINQDGGLHALVNNAGIMTPIPFIEMTDEEYMYQLDVNLVAANRLVRTFFNQLKEHQGYVINISSLNGFISSPFSGAYSITKFAMVSYSEVLRYELKKFGIKVSEIEPGFFHSSIFEKGDQIMDKKKEQSDYYKQEYNQASQQWKETRELHLKDPVLVAKKVYKLINQENPQLFNVVADRDEEDWVYQTLFRRIYKINQELENPWTQEELLEIFNAAFE